MELFKCRYLPHENEEIIGFCLNENCKNETQFCYECLKKSHSDHQDDCFRFVTMNQQIQQFIQVQNQQNKQIKEIITQLKVCFEQIQKKIDQDIKILEKMDLYLFNKEYLTFKSQINIIKKYHSKKKEKEIQQQILEMNKFLNTIKTIVSIQTKVINSENYTPINMVSRNEENQEYKKLKIQEAKILFNKGKELAENGEFENALNQFENSIKLFSEDDDVYQWKGLVLNYLYRHQDAIRCCENAIFINSKNDMAWNNKGYALSNLNRYQDAIECCEKAITINPKNDNAWNHKGYALSNLNRYQDAIECYDKAISINPNNDMVWNNKATALNYLNKYQHAIVCCENALSINHINYQALTQKGFALHKQQQYSNAVDCYVQALSICNVPEIQQLKAESLRMLKLGKKSLGKLT